VQQGGGGGERGARRAARCVGRVRLTSGHQGARAKRHPSPSRSGPGACHLTRRAKALFVHVAEALQQPDVFRGGAGAELVALLHKQLLSNTAYCQRSSVDTFAGAWRGGAR
jgi:hypothetical protein